MSSLSDFGLGYMSDRSTPVRNGAIGEAPVFVRSTRINSLLSIVFITAMGACGNFGGCGACGSTGPLPGGKLPTDQTIEGGAQIRVTPAGFDKLTSILPGIANQALSNGFCVGKQSFGFTDPIFGTFTGVRACNQNSGSGCNPGCKINTSLNNNGLTLEVTSFGTLRVNLSMTASTHIVIGGYVADLGGSCTMDITSNNFGGSFDVALGVKQSNGELDLHLQQVNAFNLNFNWSGCGFLSDVGEALTDLVDSFVGQFVIRASRAVKRPRGRR